MKHQPELKPDTLATLKAAKLFIDKPEHWCKGAIQKGNAFCVVGALLQAGYSGWAPIVALAEACPNGHDPVSYQDNPHTTHADVMAMFDLAIAKLEGLT